MEDTIFKILPYVLAVLGLGLFIWFVVRAVKTSLQQCKEKQMERTIAPFTYSNYRIVLICIAWVVAIKLITMILAHILLGGTDLFGDVPRFWTGTTDIPRYIDIAQNGYQASGDTAKNIVFFPLYPYLLRFVAALTGEYFWTGSVLSMCFLVIAGVYFFKLTREEWGEDTAARALKYFMLFPSIFFAMLPMSEGLFLMLVVLFLYHLRKGNFLIAAIAGMLAAFTRSLGVYLAIPFVVEAIFRVYCAGKAHFWKRFFKTVWPVVLIPLATVAYLEINLAVQGDPFAFLTHQEEYWSQGFGFFADTIRYLTENALTRDVSLTVSLFIPELAVIFAFLAFMILTAKRQRPMYLAYSAVIFYFSISVTWLLSAPRYMLVMFPCFMEIGVRTQNRKWDIALTIVFALCLLVFSMAFVMGCAIY